MNYIDIVEIFSFLCNHSKDSFTPFCYIAFWVECGILGTELGPRNADFLVLLQKLFCEREFVPSQKQAIRMLL
jgi:hypothetical protein